MRTSRGYNTTTVLFLNKWNDLFHLMLTKVDGEQSRDLEIRFCRTLEHAARSWPAGVLSTNSPPPTFTGLMRIMVAWMLDNTRYAVRRLSSARHARRGTFRGT